MSHTLASLDDIAEKEFDYVVIGGGTAGCVVAARLSEDPNVSVAVLEAGPAHLDDSTTDHVMSWMKTIFDEKYDWKYETVPQKISGAPFFWPRGRGLGGTTLINWMIYNLPQKQEVDAIQALGNEGWNWANFHQYAKKVQKFVVPNPQPDGDEFRNLYDTDAVGHDGPISLTFAPYSSNSEHVFQKALQKHGINIADSPLSGEISGTWKSVCNIHPDTRTRITAAKGYLVPAMERPNLKVLTDAYVSRIKVKKVGEDAIAEAVEFEHGGKTYEVKVGKEAILSAGVVKTPQILELSGIGDPNVLREHGIEVIVDLPTVGTNVQEHTVIGLLRLQLKDDKDIVTSAMLDNAQFASEIGKRYGTKPPFELTYSSITMVPLQSCSDKASEIVQRAKEAVARDVAKFPPGLKEQYDLQLKLLEDPTVPEFEILYMPFSFPTPVPLPDKPHINLCVILSRPFTRGTIHINSSDPTAMPAIDPQYCDRVVDFEVLREAIKFSRKVTQTSPFSEIVEKEVTPGPDIQSDEQIGEFIKGALYSTFHTCGGCPMLPHDLGGAVDSKFKVYGTKNIRVADLSILPLHISGHPQGTVFTIGEMAANIIKKEGKRQ